MGLLGPSTAVYRYVARHLAVQVSRRTWTRRHGAPQSQVHDGLVYSVVGAGDGLMSSAPLRPAGPLEGRFRTKAITGMSSEAFGRDPGGVKHKHWMAHNNGWLKVRLKMPRCHFCDWSTGPRPAWNAHDTGRNHFRCLPLLHLSHITKDDPR
jgi:hypothetical protein